MADNFYKNTKTKLWDERKSSRQIIADIEWEIGLEAGDIIREISKVLRKGQKFVIVNL